MKRMIPLCAAIVLGLLTGTASAQNLTIGMKAAVDSADPHLLFTPNRNVDLQVYEPLIYQDRYLKPEPRLAVSWKPLDPTTWEIKLREGVKFSDGTPFTSEDVVFSIERGQQIQGARTYRAYLRDIVSVEAIDPTTVRMKTKEPTSLLPLNLTSIGMVSAKAAKDATAEDFNGGSAAIGTGPYRWVKWTPGQSVELARNDSFRDGPEPWDKVTIRFMPNDSARVAALLSGDVDVIDAVPGGLTQQIRDNANTGLVEDTSVFLVYLSLDRFRDNSPFIRAANGSQLGKNPFKDSKVRDAVNIAINRVGLTERLMRGGATPTGQLAPEGFAGYDTSIAVPSYDAAKAKALLVEAGYPEGFQLTLHCMNDRFSGDAQVCQALGAMFSTIGIKTTVETLPSSVFYSRASTGGPNGEPAFSAFMAIYGTPTGSPINTLTNLINTADKDRGLGVSNRAGYSNPDVDRLIEETQTTFDEAGSEAKIIEATRLALDDDALLPLFFIKSIWGTKKNITLDPRGDGFTMAQGIRTLQ